MTHFNNPRCPNEKCLNHSAKYKANDAFSIVEIDKGGLTGKILAMNVANMVFCNICGYIVGVTSHG